MTRVMLLALLATAVLLESSCALRGGSGRMGVLKKGTIEIYRDQMDVCQTKTTPFFRVNKRTQSKVEWKIIDEDTGCLDAADATVEIRFDKGDDDLMPSCEKKNKRKIECDAGAAVIGVSGYSVYLGTSREDPVLEIEEI